MGIEMPYHKLLVWREADQFVKHVYDVTKDFPGDEKYNVISQLRRAALSIPLNVVEGQASGSTKQFLRYLNIARGSCAESAYLIEFAESQKYLSDDICQRLLEEVSRLTYGIHQLSSGLKRKL
jgi:four helix bundle protein